MTTTKCKCGKKMSKHARECNACHRAKMAALVAEALKIVATGKCPYCGSPLKRNLAMAGWYQCVAYAAPDFREPAYRNLPACSFQTFTE